MTLRLKTRPYPHQVKAVRRALAQGSHAFFFEPRCGKTKAALDAIAIANHRGQVQRVAVVGPLIALDVWVGQINEHLAVPAVVKVTGEDIIRFGPNRRHSPQDLRIFLVNYDKYSRRGHGETYRNAHIRALERWDPDLIVLDESHRVKSSGAVRSQALWRMVRRLRKERRLRQSVGPHVYLLTGTPNPKGYIDLFAQYRLLDEEIFGTSRADFEDDYCVFGRGKMQYTVVRYRRKKQLLRKIAAHSTIVTAEEAGLSGEQFFNPIHVTLPGKVRDAYDKLATEFLAEIKGETITAANAGVRRMRLLQLTGGFTTDGRQTHRAKIEAARDWLADLREQGEHVVVYARFLAEVAALDKLCRALGFRTGVITGAVKRGDRTREISAFQRGPGPRVLVFQVGAGSMAIELTRSAEEFFYSLPDDWVAFYGCLERVRGPRQTRPVRYTYLLARGTVDSSVLVTLRGKRDMHKELMKSPKSFLFGL